jgi:hypothetical protein
MASESDVLPSFFDNSPLPSSAEVRNLKVLLCQPALRRERRAWLDGKMKNLTLSKVCRTVAPPGVIKLTDRLKMNRYN